MNRRNDDETDDREPGLEPAEGRDDDHPPRKRRSKARRATAAKAEDDEAEDDEAEDRRNSARDAADDDEDGDDEDDGYSARDDGDGDDEDEDADEDEDDADEDDDEAEEAAAAPARAPRRSLGPTLLVLGGGMWAIAAALRCGAPDPGPSLSVSPDAAEPGLSARPSDEPAPAEARDDEDDEARIEGPGDEAEPAAAGMEQQERPEEDDAEDDAPPLPEPLPENWAQNPKPPSKVTYTIRHGGSIKNVANLFKIFHHEITALNPGTSLEAELPPQSKVVVYLADERKSSESVGYPSDGSLEGGVPMMEGPGRQLKAIPWKSWGTAHTVALLDSVLRRWAELGHEQPILVGNMAAREGGKLEPHSTHQSGRDVDVGYPQKLPPGEELNWREMNADNLDPAETWALLQLLRSTGQVEVIFIDTSIQKLLYDYAVSSGVVPKNELSRWLEYPRSPPRRGSLVQHVKGHVDHIHVRFKCQPHETRCKSNER